MPQTPITTNKLYSDVKAYGDLQHFETPYVVKFHKIHPLADTQEVFTFTHPNRCAPCRRRSADEAARGRTVPAGPDRRLI